METPITHEIVSLVFLPNINFATQQRHMEQIGSFVAMQEGFVSRQAFFDQESSRWVDHVTWRDKESAITAMQNGMKAAELAAILAEIDQSQLLLGHYEQLI